MAALFEALDGTPGPLLQNVRTAVREHGRDHALLLYPSERKFIDAIAAALGEDSAASGAVYSGFAVTSLPHKRLPDDQEWEKHGHRLRLTIRPGSVHIGDGKRKTFGVPYGSRARVLLYYCQTEALKNESREIEMGPSLHSWIERLQLPDGGQTYRDVRDQLHRLSACSLQFEWDGDQQQQRAPGGLDAKFIKGYTGLGMFDPDQPPLWRESILLDEDFYASLRDHAVPLWEPAIRELSNQSAALDVYTWLAYRLHVLDKPRRLSWLSVAEQFGSGYGRLRDFRKRFLDVLKSALAVYETANVSVDEEGIVLHPSAPPIPARTLRRVS